ncbi:MAG TPA: SRPBCC family protein [Drouetiella sp.]|jgi:Polyketide cyclase / dehydrase and lipid transport
MAYVRKMILCGLIFSFGALPANAEKNTDAMVSQTMVINAPVKAVWEAMRTLRRNDPAHRKILSSSGGDYVVQETFEGIPVIGEAICTYREHETPMQKLKYELIKSDKLKAFAGEWNLTPAGDNQTKVELSSRTDAGVCIPFADKITRSRTSKSITKRLEEVRDIATKPQVALKQ